MIGTTLSARESIEKLFEITVRHRDDFHLDRAILFNDRVNRNTNSINILYSLIF